MIESIIGLLMVILGIAIGMYFQYWIICLIIDAARGGGGGTPHKQETRLVRTMPARRQLARAYSMIRGLA